MKIDWEHLQDNKDRLEHFASLSELRSHQWIDGKAKGPVNIKRMPYKRLCNLRDWMLMNSYRQTPYDDTKQFKCVLTCIRIKEEWEQAAREIMEALKKK